MGRSVRGCVVRGVERAVYLFFFRGLALGLLGSFWACDGGAVPEDVAQPSAPVEEPEPSDIGSPCNSAALVEQCPVGSVPLVEASETSGCEQGAELQNAAGEVIGVCRQSDSCTFVCNFQDPCRCGIEELTRDKVVCAACTTACGNAVCETGEDPQNCPLDCGATCVPEQFRCNGTDREVCENNGSWTLLTCREDQACVVALAEDSEASQALCQTSLSQGGGGFEGLGVWELGAETSHRAVSVPLVQFDFEPLRFVDNGHLLGRNQDGFLRVSLEDVDDLQPESLPGGEAFEIQSDTKTARQFQVAELSSERLQNMKDFGGVLDDFLRGRLAQFQQGQGALSKDGSLYAYSFATGLSQDALQASIVVWDTETGETIRLLSYEDMDVSRAVMPELLAFSHNNKVLAVSYGERLVLWDLDTGKFAARLDIAQVRADTLLLDTSGKNRMVLGQPRHVQVWDLTPLLTGNDPVVLWERRTMGGVQGEGELRPHAISTNGELLALENGDLLEIDTQEELGSLPGRGPILFEPGHARIVRGDALWVEEL